MAPTFSPALHRQRHQFVIDYVKKNKPQKVVDLGCGECTLLKSLRFRREIKHLVGVDIDGAKVKKKMQGLAPMSTDYLQPSFDQLLIELYQGSVTQKDVRLRGFDLVTSIELIEHLTLPDVECFSEVVFGYMTPVAVIVSTPNFEFNSLFHGLEGFRHSDHKFEWTRAEFKSWALKVCLKYGYKVEFTGVGQAPPGQSVGFCSQIGVFLQLSGDDVSNMLLGDEEEGVFSYTLLYSKMYPSLWDNNILRKVLVSEVLYCAETWKKRWIEETTQERDSHDTLCQTEEGREELTGQAEIKQPIEQYGRGESEILEGQDGGAFWTNNQVERESCKLQRCVAVPLSVLWSSFPKIKALGGNLSNLRLLLMDDTEIKLSQDGSAVLLNDLEQDSEDDVDQGLEDSGYSVASIQCSHRDEPEEDWEDI